MQASTFKIAWRNLGRNKRRTALAVGAIALGQLTLVFVNGLMAGSFQNMVKTLTGPLVGHVQIHEKDWREERAMDLFLDRFAETKAAIEALPGVERVAPRIYAPVLSASGEESAKPADAEPAVIVGVDVDIERREGGILASLEPGVALGDHSVALGDILATRLGLREGEQLAVIGQDADGFPVSDLFVVEAVIDSRVEIVKSMGIVMPYQLAESLLVMEDKVHEIVVQGLDYKEAEVLAEKVAAIPALADAEVLTWREAIPELTRIIDLKKWLDFIFLGLVFIAAAAGIANTAMMSTFERTHEFGMLLAVGSRPNRIITMVLIESVIIGLVAVALGSLIGTALVLFTGHTGINYAALGGKSAEDIAFGTINLSFIIYPRFELRHIVYGVVAVTLTSIIASLWPAAWAARLEPVEALHS